MNDLILRIGIFILIVTIIYIYMKRRNKKEDKYLWVGPGEDPFKEKKD